MTSQHSDEKPAWWVPVWKLVVHILLGSLLFAIIFTPAVLLDFLVQWLKETTNISDFLSVLLTGAKIALAVVDAILYFLWVLRMAWIFVLELWGYETNDPHQ